MIFRFIVHLAGESSHMADLAERGPDWISGDEGNKSLITSRSALKVDLNVP